MDSFYNYLKKELQGWKIPEITGLIIVFGIILYNAIVLNDNPIAIISAICGILYTVIAGKGKISCYIFGITGSSFYGYLSFINALWGNLLLYVGYYIPMQILGIIKWRRHLNKETQEIYKTHLSQKERGTISIISVLMVILCSVILNYFKDSHPIMDSATTILSIVGMYLTVRRCIEQWIVWTIVNSIAVIMWIRVIQSGQKAYSTMIMWSVYLVLGIYFYIQWEKEVQSNNI